MFNISSNINVIKDKNKENKVSENFDKWITWLGFMQVALWTTLGKIFANIGK